MPTISLSRGAISSVSGTNTVIQEIHHGQQGPRQDQEGARRRRARPGGHSQEDEQREALAHRERRAPRLLAVLPARSRNQQQHGQQESPLVEEPPRDEVSAQGHELVAPIFAARTRRNTPVETKDE